MMSMLVLSFTVSFCFLWKAVILTANPYFQWITDAFLSGKR